MGAALERGLPSLGLAVLPDVFEGLQEPLTADLGLGQPLPNGGGSHAYW